MQVFHNTPSAGYIAWQDVHIQYKGVTYNIPNGNTNKKYVYWLYSSPDVFQTSDTMPSLGPDDLLVFLNKNGTYAVVPKTQLVDGSLIVSDSVMTDALAANSVTAAKIAAGAVTADKVAANAIGAGAIAAGAVIADKIAAGAVTADKLAALSVTADKIATGAISADKLSVGMEIDADSHPVRAASNQIWIDQTGLNMKNAAVSNVMMNLNHERLGFWDPDGLPTIGLGAVQDMAQQLGSDMLYGLLMAQGEVRATQAVLRQSLADYSIGQSKVEDGTMTLAKLSELISVTIPDRFQQHSKKNKQQRLTNPGFEDGNLSGWSAAGTVSLSGGHSGSFGAKLAPGSISQSIDASPGQIWTAEVWAKSSYAVSFTFYLRFLDSSGSTISSLSHQGTATNSWERHKLTGTAPSGTAKVQVYAQQGGSSNNAYVDDFSLDTTPDLITTGYATWHSDTIPETEACEQIRVVHNISNPNARTVYVRGLVNDVVKYELTSTDTSPTIGVSIDVRGVSGDLTVVVQAKASAADPVWIDCTVLQNQRLPLRAAAPKYAVTSSSESYCDGDCERSCQTGCQLSCESQCQASCQTACQNSCQSTCELTSQGGGCFVEGTLVSIYDAETGDIREVPIEILTPGMLMPAYNPATDSIEVTECVSNTKSKTGTLYVIEVERDRVLRATGEQPFDVLRANKLTGQLGWYRVQARYLEPGDLFVRPFDEGDRLPKVLKVTETIVPPTWVWNPRTASKRYIVEGFADSIVKE